MRYLLLLTALSVAAGAQAKSPDDLARRYVEAAKARSAERQLALYHPAVTACFDKNPWYRDHIKANAERSVTAGAKFTDGYRADVRPVHGPTPVYLLPDSLFSYPVQATHQLDILSREGPETATAAVLFIVDTRSGWYALIPCPKPGAEAWVEGQLSTRSRQQARADSLASTLADPLRSELLELLRARKKVSAVFRYIDVAHVDTSTAYLVVGALAKHHTR
jgi:hypothetical protein